jgi:hypothetical protein
MKRIVIHESISADSDWFRCSYSADPHPTDVCLASDLTEAGTKRYIKRGSKEVTDLVAGMPLGSPKWQLSEISESTTYGMEGKREWRTRVRLKMEDLGRCICGQLVMNGELRAVVIVLPAHRKHMIDDCILLRIAELLPAHVRDNVTKKIKDDGLDARGTVAFTMLPRKVIKREPPALTDYLLLMVRAGLRWAEKRDAAQRARRISRMAA